MALVHIKKLENTDIIVQEEILYSTKDTKLYIDKFRLFQHKGIIENQNKFEDSCWRIKTGVKMFTINFKIHEDKYIQWKVQQRIKLSYSEFILAIKSFILFKLDNIGAHSISNFISFFKRIMKKTEFLEHEKIDEYLYEKTEQIDTNLKYLIEFISYLNNKITTQNYIDDMNEKMEDAFYLLSDKKRTLPAFESVFKFDVVIDKFIQVCTEDEKERYFPIVLWWKMTTIIPLRVTEFTVIPKDCIFQNENSYFLKINRSTNKKNKDKYNVRQHNFESCYREYTVAIDKKTYDLILEYKKIVDKYDEIKGFFYGEGEPYDRKFLISSRSQYKLSNIKYDIEKVRYDKEYFGYKQMEYLKNKFFVEIVNKKFDINVIDTQEDTISNKEINKIQLMDTRHFAIINMVLMGYEPPVIKEMAGHQSIYTSYSYFNHINEFMKCYIISKSKVLAMERSAEKDIVTFENIENALATGNARYNAAKISTRELDAKRKKVDGGWCVYEKEDFEPCRAVGGQHCKCKYFIYDYDKGAKSVKSDLDELKYELDSEIETIKYLVKKHNKIKNFNEIFNTKLNKMYEDSNLIINFLVNQCEIKE